MKLLEHLFEAFLWNSRIIIILPVLFSLLAAFALFFAGSFEIFSTVCSLFKGGEDGHSYSKLMIGIVGSIDLYLIGMVLLIFAFGIYELFLSKIDIARQGEKHNLLESTSLDELKTKLLKVIIMVLIVAFFKAILSTSFETPLEMLYFGVAILAVAACTFLLRTSERE